MFAFYLKDTWFFAWMHTMVYLIRLTVVQKIGIDKLFCIKIKYLDQCI